MSSNKNHLNQQIQEAYALLASWQQKKLLAENPGEAGRCQVEIDRIEEEINQIEEKIYRHKQREKFISHQGLDSFQIFTCDRKEQTKEFKKNFEKKKTTRSKVQFYIIHGEEDQSPDGLYQRLSRLELKRLLKVEPFANPNAIPLETDEDEDYRRTLLLRELYESLRLDIDDYPPKIRGINNLIRSPFAKDKEYLIIAFKLYSFDWQDTMAKLLDWFVRKYCDEQKLSSGAPYFIFFIKVNYSRENFLARLFKGPAKGRIVKNLKRLPKVMWMSELGKVPREDIKAWLDIITENAFEKEKLMQTYFPARKAFDMAYVETKLKEILSNH